MKVSTLAGHGACVRCSDLQAEVERLRARLRAAEAALDVRDGVLNLWNQTRQEHESWLIKEIARVAAEHAAAATAPSSTEDNT